MGSTFVMALTEESGNQQAVLENQEILCAIAKGNSDSIAPRNFLQLEGGAWNGHQGPPCSRPVSDDSSSRAVG